MNVRTVLVMTAVAAVSLTSASLAGCSAKKSDESQGSAPAGAQVSVTATDTTCELSATEGSTGATTFAVTNNGTKATELYVYTKDGSVLAEVENVSPGLKRDLIVDLTEPGTYKLACKPGGVGDGIRADFTVKG